MRDIRLDLAERLKAVVNELTALQERARDLQEQRAQLATLLDAENRRFHSTSPVISPPSDVVQAGLDRLTERAEGTTLTLMIRRALADGKPHTLFEIADYVAGEHYDFAGKSKLRTVNFALLAMFHADKVTRKKMQNGISSWQLKQARG